MVRDPFRSLKPTERVVVYCIGAALAAVFVLAIVAAFFANAGPISGFLVGVFIAVGCVAAFLAQRWFNRTVRDAAEFGEGPIVTTRDATIRSLQEMQRAKKRAADSEDRGTSGPDA